MIDSNRVAQRRIIEIELDGFTAPHNGTTAVHVGRLEAAKATLAEWRKRGLDKPYGERAYELGIGLLEHPPPLEREPQPE